MSRIETSNKTGWFFRESMIGTAPMLRLTRNAFEQTISWSSEDDRPVSLREHLAFHFPELGLKLGFETGEKKLKRGEELTVEELIKISLTRLKNDPDRSGIEIPATGEKYTFEQILEQVHEGTELGRRLIQAERENLKFLERMASEGKIVLTDEELGPLRVSDFPF